MALIVLLSAPIPPPPPSSPSPLPLPFPPLLPSSFLGTSGVFLPLPEGTARLSHIHPDPLDTHVQQAQHGRLHIGGNQSASRGRGVGVHIGSHMRRVFWNFQGENNYYYLQLPHHKLTHHISTSLLASTLHMPISGAIS